MQALYLTIIVMVTVFIVCTAHTGPGSNKEITLLSCCFLSDRKGSVECKNHYLPVSMTI